MRRDPRSLLELRRFAYRAAREPAARYVLHDALLETIPAYHEEIATAERLAKKIKSREYAVAFYPMRMGRYDRQRGRIWKRTPVSASLLFTIETGPRGLPSLKTRAWERELSPSGGVVITYRTRGYL